VTLTTQQTLSKNRMDDLASTFAREGYLCIPSVVSPERLSKLRDELIAEFMRARAAGELDGCGGMVSGHLNCFPGAQSRFVYDALAEHGVFDLVRRLSPQAVRAPNVGCNLNLPGSSPQNYHIDGYASTPFMIVNVAAVDTTIENGAMEATPGSHQREYKYHEFVLARRPGMRAKLNAGDVILRTSSLWHRGMPNRSKAIRPMLAFSWEEGGSNLDDPYSAHGGKIAILPNRYTSSLTGKLRERAFAAAPALGSGYLFLRSMLGG
jgi:hypothetical protein